MEQQNLDITPAIMGTQCHNNQQDINHLPLMTTLMTRVNTTTPVTSGMNFVLTTPQKNLHLLMQLHLNYVIVTS